MMARELVALVQRFAAQLQGDHRALFEAHFIQGKSLRQIAAERGKSLMPIRYRLEQQRRRLRRYLRAHGYGPVKGAP
jgi:DNA-directed RNA polymerase specialized sigma24 family protein